MYIGSNSLNVMNYSKLEGISTMVSENNNIRNIIQILSILFTMIFTKYLEYQYRILSCVQETSKHVIIAV